MPHRQGKWRRPILKVEVRPRAGLMDWDIQTTSYGSQTGEVCDRVNEAVRETLKQLLAERKLQQSVADIKLPFGAQFRPWLPKLLGRLFGKV